MGRWILKLEICLLPLQMTPLLGYLLAEGFLDFGGGEKDLILLIPWIAWSLLYTVVFAVGWLRGLPTRRSFAYAAGGATLAMTAAWLVLLVWSPAWLGVSG